MKIILTILTTLLSLTTFAQRSEILLEKNWKFHRGDVIDAQAVQFDDATWQNVTIPHDWAIYGPFSRDNDLQYKAVFVRGADHFPFVHIHHFPEIVLLAGVGKTFGKLHVEDGNDGFHIDDSVKRHFCKIIIHTAPLLPKFTSIITDFALQCKGDDAIIDL